MFWPVKQPTSKNPQLEVTVLVSLLCACAGYYLPECLWLCEDLVVYVLQAEFLLTLLTVFFFDAQGGKLSGNHRQPAFKHQTACRTHSTDACYVEHIHFVLTSCVKQQLSRDWGRKKWKRLKRISPTKALQEMWFDWFFFSICIVSFSRKPPKFTAFLSRSVLFFSL